MFSNQLFLNVEKAKKYLAPILRYLVLPFMISEMLLILVYQSPKEDDSDSIVPKIFSLEKYFLIGIKKDKFDRYYPYIVDNTKLNNVSLIFKALVYMCISIQIQIIYAKIYSKLEHYIFIGKLKGKATTRYYNNLKIFTYFNYQHINLTKE